MSGNIKLSPCQNICGMDIMPEPGNSTEELATNTRMTIPRASSLSPTWELTGSTTSPSPAASSNNYNSGWLNSASNSNWRKTPLKIKLPRS